MKARETLCTYLLGYDRCFPEVSKTLRGVGVGEGQISVKGHLEGLSQLNISDPGRVLYYMGHSVDRCPGNFEEGEVEAGGGAGEWREGGLEKFRGVQGVGEHPFG